MSRSAEMPEQPILLESAKKGDREAFARLVEPYRRELQLHCYRMLGAFYDAEDLVQDTFLRAWRGIGAFQFRGRGSFRAWLYRMATNTCLTALAHRSNARKVLPERLGPPSDRIPEACGCPSAPPERHCVRGSRGSPGSIAFHFPGHLRLRQIKHAAGWDEQQDQYKSECHQGKPMRNVPWVPCESACERIPVPPTRGR